MTLVWGTLSSTGVTGKTWLCSCLASRQAITMRGERCFYEYGFCCGHVCTRTTRWLFSFPFSVENEITIFSFLHVFPTLELYFKRCLRLIKNVNEASEDEDEIIFFLCPVRVLARFTQKRSRGSRLDNTVLEIDTVV
ncbi:uncharacterized protein LOC112589959 isoform X1 [Harpegnathos saltator]|uniref:uncharacterized protein LOC112589959 isoform X1 n=1 Tax=Harpegnathos saltator TaxID=610380 RepID=UPI000DBEE36F|nr:uncharacterized protein LOC112589959 isoform X1 [Harpegnathos saltator]